MIVLPLLSTSTRLLVSTASLIKSLIVRPTSAPDTVVAEVEEAGKRNWYAAYPKPRVRGTKNAITAKIETFGVLLFNSVPPPHVDI